MSSWADFEKIDLRVGKIVDVQEFPEARKPAFKITVDFGALGLKKSSAQITELYKKEDLLGRQVICVFNFLPKKIGPFVSEVLIMGVYSGKGVVLLKPDFEVKEGEKIG